MDRRPGYSPEVPERAVRENRELRRNSEILRTASTYFA